MLRAFCAARAAMASGLLTPPGGPVYGLTSPFVVIGLVAGGRFGRGILGKDPGERTTAAGGRGDDGSPIGRSGDG